MPSRRKKASNPFFPIRLVLLYLSSCWIDCLKRNVKEQYEHQTQRHSHIFICPFGLSYHTAYTLCCKKLKALITTKESSKKRGDLTSASSKKRLISLLNDIFQSPLWVELSSLFDCENLFLMNEKSEWMKSDIDRLKKSVN